MRKFIAIIAILLEAVVSKPLMTRQRTFPMCVIRFAMWCLTVMV